MTTLMKGLVLCCWARPPLNVPRKLISSFSLPAQGLAFLGLSAMVVRIFLSRSRTCSANNSTRAGAPGNRGWTSACSATQQCATAVETLRTKGERERKLGRFWAVKEEQQGVSTEVNVLNSVRASTETYLSNSRIFDFGKGRSGKPKASSGVV